MEAALFLSKVFDDTKRIRLYSDQLLNLVRKEFSTRKIDIYDYERFINLLTCLNLQTEETRKEIDRFIRRETNKRVPIELRVQGGLENDFIRFK